MNVPRLLAQLTTAVPIAVVPSLVWEMLLPWWHPYLAVGVFAFPLQSRVLACHQKYSSHDRRNPWSKIMSLVMDSIRVEMMPEVDIVVECHLMTALQSLAQGLVYHFY